MSKAILVIAGVDSCGGAGMLRDYSTAHDLGVPVRVAVTAVTAQDDDGVHAFHPMPPEIVAAQIASAGPVGAVKIGMLGTADIVEAVVEALPFAIPVVLDPVLRSSSGHDLLERQGLHALMLHLLPRVALLTPNLPELAAFGTLLGLHDGDEATIVGALQCAGASEVLVKGGHAAAAAICEDRLYRPGGALVRFSSPRLPLSLRGTGCQLSTGIAAGLVQGLPLEQAIEAARHVLTARFAIAMSTTMNLSSHAQVGPGGDRTERRNGQTARNTT